MTFRDTISRHNQELHFSGILKISIFCHVCLTCAPLCFLVTVCSTTNVRYVNRRRNFGITGIVIFCLILLAIAIWLGGKGLLYTNSCLSLLPGFIVTINILSLPVSFFGSSALWVPEDIRDIYSFRYKNTGHLSQYYYHMWRTSGLHPRQWRSSVWWAWTKKTNWEGVWLFKSGV